MGVGSAKRANPRCCGTCEDARALTQRGALIARRLDSASRGLHREHAQRAPRGVTPAGSFWPAHMGLVGSGRRAQGAFLQTQSRGALCPLLPHLPKPSRPKPARRFARAARNATTTPGAAIGRCLRSAPGARIRWRRLRYSRPHPAHGIAPRSAEGCHRGGREARSRARATARGPARPAGRALPYCKGVHDAAGQTLGTAVRPLTRDDTGARTGWWRRDRAAPPERRGRVHAAE